MKILHIAPEPSAALVSARVLHGIAQNVTPAWVETPDAALLWLQNNRDTEAVIVEVQDQGCPAFVEQLRGLGLTIPVVVVAGSPRLESALASLNSGADGYVVAGPSLEADLPRAVTAAIEHKRSRRLLLSHIVTELGAGRVRVEQHVARVEEEALRRTAQRGGSELAAAQARLADLQARQAASMARETRICQALQQRLLELETALGKADERRASEAASFADQLARRHAEFTGSLAQAAQARDGLAAELNAATAALDEERKARRADATAAAEHLRRREAELRSELAEAVAGRTALDHALAAAEAAHQDARQRAALDLVAANERQAALEDLLTQETDRRTGLDRQLTAAAAANQEAEQRHASELADLKARYHAALEENAAIRAAFERQTDEAASALDRVNRERTAEAAAAAEHLASTKAEMGARLAEAFAARSALEHTLTETEAAQQHAMARAAEDMAAAAARQAELEERLAAESDARAALEGDLAALRMESARELRARDEEIRQIHLEEDMLRDLLGTTQEQLQELHRTVDEEREAHEAARAASESELQRISADYSQIRQSFNGLQSSFHTLEQIAGEHAAERTRLEGVVAERDSQLSAQAERHRVAEQGAHEAFTTIQEKLRQALETGGAEIARLQQEINALRRELDASRSQSETLRGVAERVPDLQTQLERSQNERRRQFERAPYALCRCSPTGSITEANHSFVALLGGRRADELRNMDFVAAAQDSAGDLSWLLDRARTTRKTETVETQWKTRDGRKLVVRLQALATTTGSIEIVAEDITVARGLEERLRQSQRMEAVGRLASEVAITCDALLSDVARGADEWLARVGSDDVLRRHAERLLTDVMRAASFLRQLQMYGNEQIRALEPVSAQRVLRDLAPVLKRLVGDQIELVLPKPGGAFNVDVEAERLERVFINVAGYARQRMPSGGQVRIELATTAVGRRFVARYANVRPGDHVLITVTELPAISEPRADGERGSRSSDRPGVDLGVLVDLIASCGGHLWLEAQPAGNMVVKIHLPKPPAATATESRGGRLSKWFRSPSSGNARA